MWKLSNQDNFLHFDCTPELVIYNKSLRSTSLLAKENLSVFRLFLEKPQKSYDIENIIAELILDDMNESVIAYVDTIVESLCRASLIEKSI